MQLIFTLLEARAQVILLQTKRLKAKKTNEENCFQVTEIHQEKEAEVYIVGECLDIEDTTQESIQEGNARASCCWLHGDPQKDEYTRAWVAAKP